MRAAIYCRVSTDEQDNDKQEFICRDYCTKNNIEIFKIYRDIISGATTSRTELNNLLEDLRACKFDAIIVTKLDRLGRSIQHLLSLINEFNKRGVAFIATTQNIDTSSAAGKLQLHILGAFAEFERNIISERTIEGLKRKRAGKRGKDKKPRTRKFFRKPLESY